MFTRRSVLDIEKSIACQVYDYIQLLSVNPVVFRIFLFVIVENVDPVLFLASVLYESSEKKSIYYFKETVCEQKLDKKKYSAYIHIKPFPIHFSYCIPERK